MGRQLGLALADIIVRCSSPWRSSSTTMRKLQGSQAQLRAAAGVAAATGGAQAALKEPVLPRGWLAAAAALARHCGGWAALAHCSVVTSTSCAVAANRGSKGAPAGVPDQVSGPSTGCQRQDHAWYSPALWDARVLLLQPATLSLPDQCSGCSS